MEQVQIAVVGAGTAGAAAAIEAARAGAQVVLFDEHPVDIGLMAQDIPFHFGERMLATAGNRGSMLPRVVGSNPLVSEAQEAGVDVRLGTAVWSTERDSVLGVANESRSDLVRFEKVVFAAGARDLSIAFRGWEKAGVVGAAAALTLLDKYQAFGGTRVVVLGAGDLGLHVAARAIDRGIEVPAVIDVWPEVRGSERLLSELQTAGTAVHTSTSVVETLGGEQVEGIAIAPLSDPGSRTEIACDTICLAIGLVPTIDLLYWTGCQIEFDGSRGGFVPRVDENSRTTVDGVYVAGDASGVVERSFQDATLAESKGRLSGIAAAESLGFFTGQDADNRRAEVGTAQRVPRPDSVEYRLAWQTALDAAAGPDVQVCVCEEVTRGDLLAMIERGPQHPDQVKRLTRAGMGYCQGRRCREQIQMLVHTTTGQPMEEVPLASYRPPFRPLPLDLIQNEDETPEEREAFGGNTAARRRRRLMQQRPRSEHRTG